MKVISSLSPLDPRLLGDGWREGEVERHGWMQLSRRRDGEQRICENRRGEKKTIVDIEAAAAAASSKQQAEAKSSQHPLWLI